MKITNFEAEAIWYEPDYMDNRELPEGDRMAVLLEPMTRNEVRRAEESISSIRAGKKSKINFTKRHNEMRDRLMAARVRDVVGLEVEVMGSGGVESTEAVTDAKRLLAVADDDLLNDVFEAMRDGSKLAEGVRGKSESASGSSSRQDLASGAGAVLDAEARNTPSKTNGAGPEDANVEQPSVNIDFDPGLQRCPWSQLDAEIWTVLGWWRDWRSFQLLPYDGGFGDQPYYVAEAIEVCEQEAVRYESEMATRERRRLENRANG